MSNFNKVGIFMKTFGQEVKTKPSFSTDKINKLRIDLIKEELEELTNAMKEKDLTIRTMQDAVTRRDSVTIALVTSLKGNFIDFNDKDIVMILLLATSFFGFITFITLLIVCCCRNSSTGWTCTAILSCLCSFVAGKNIQDVKPSL